MNTSEQEKPFFNTGGKGNTSNSQFDANSMLAAHFVANNEGIVTSYNSLYKIFVNALHREFASTICHDPGFYNFDATDIHRLLFPIETDIEHYPAVERQNRINVLEESDSPYLIPLPWRCFFKESANPWIQDLLNVAQKHQNIVENFIYKGNLRSGVEELARLLSSTNTNKAETVVNVYAGVFEDRNRELSESSVFVAGVRVSRPEGLASWLGNLQSPEHKAFKIEYFDIVAAWNIKLDWREPNTLTAQWLGMQPAFHDATERVKLHKETERLGKYEALSKIFATARHKYAGENTAYTSRLQRLKDLLGQIGKMTEGQTILDALNAGKQERSYALNELGADVEYLRSSTQARGEFFKFMRFLDERYEKEINANLLTFLKLTTEEDVRNLYERISHEVKDSEEEGRRNRRLHHSPAHVLPNWKAVEIPYQAVVYWLLHEMVNNARKYAPLGDTIDFAVAQEQINSQESSVTFRIENTLRLDPARLEEDQECKNGATHEGPFFKSTLPGTNVHPLCHPCLRKAITQLTDSKENLVLNQVTSTGSGIFSCDLIVGKFFSTSNCKGEISLHLHEADTRWRIAVEMRICYKRREGR